MMMRSCLKIHNLHARTNDGHEILHGLSLSVKSGECHVIMGPNGSGKSTLANVLMGHYAYTVTSGSISFDAEDITNLPTDCRARLGLFLGFQYPSEIAGVDFSDFLFLSANETRKNHEKRLTPLNFRKLLKSKSNRLGITDKIANRSLNEGFSGGEKKKSEILQLSILKPKFAILDEPDSGLDIDALRIVASMINGIDYPLGLVIITHSKKILEYINPDFIHIMKKGKITQSGKSDLAEKIEESGYECV